MYLDLYFSYLRLDFPALFLYSHHASYCYLFNDEVVIKTFQQGSDEINYVDKLLLHEKHV